jgi:hypothetical protein
MKLAFCWFALDRQVSKPCVAIASPAFAIRHPPLARIGSNEVVLWWNRRALNVQAAVSLAEHDLLQETISDIKWLDCLALSPTAFFCRHLGLEKRLPFPVLLCHPTPA